MTHLDLVDGKIHARIARSGKLEIFPTDMNGVRALWKRMNEEEEHGAMQVICSSSVDFPEENGLSEDYDLRGMLETLQHEEEESDLKEMFDKIDQLVEEGKIEELAERTKNYIRKTVELLKEY